MGSPFLYVGHIIDRFHSDGIFQFPILILLGPTFPTLVFVPRSSKVQR